MKISPLAGKLAPPEILVNVPRLVTAYYTGVPDPKVPAQRVAFGTSGHRGSSFNLCLLYTSVTIKRKPNQGILLCNKIVRLPFCRSWSF